MGSRHNIGLNQLFDDLIKAAEIAEVPYDADVLRKNLDAYGDFYSRAAVTFKTTTKPKDKRGLTARYVELKVPHDPYSIAVTNGFITEENHPIYNLYHEIKSKYPILGYGVDVDVAYGLSKIWAFIQIPQPISEAFTMPSLPESIKNSLDYFSRNNLNDFSLFAIDYRDKTINVYFMMNEPGIYSTEEISDMISQAGFKVPTQEILEHCSKTATIYYTYSWTTTRIERLCFGMAAPDPSAVPTHLDPLVDVYTKHAPIIGEKRGFIYSMTFSHSGDYIKIENDYSGTMIDLMLQGAQAPAMLEELKMRVSEEVIRGAEKVTEKDWEPEILNIFEKIVADVPEVFRAMVKPLLLETAEKKCSERNGDSVNESDLITALFDITPEAFQADAIKNLEAIGVEYQKYIKSG